MFYRVRYIPDGGDETVFTSGRFFAGHVDEAEARLRQVYGRVAVDGATLAYTDRFAGDERFSIASAHYDGAFDCTAEMTDFVVNLAQPGCEWLVGRDSGELSAEPTLFQPGRPLTARIDHLVNETVVLSAPSLRAAARALYADDGLEVRFADSRPISRELGRAWAAAYRFAAADPSLLADDLFRASAYRALATITLETFPLLGDRTRRYETARGLLRAFRRAQQFIDDHASLPITEMDMARAAGTDAAHLRLAFHAHEAFDRSPQQYLQQVRITAAHHELLVADSTAGATVAAIATRWGFGSASRFAAQYRTVYGVPPSWTLRQ